MNRWSITLGLEIKAILRITVASLATHGIAT